MNLTKKFPIAVTSVLALAVTGCAVDSDTAADPDSFPSKNLELVVYTDPGTSVDSMARALDPLLEDELGQTVTVNNQPGANGTNGLRYMLDAPHDGHTIGVWTTTYSSLMAQGVGGFDGEGIGYLCQLLVEPQSFNVRPDSQFKSIDDIVEYAKANPGELRVSGGAGAGSYARLFALQFQELTGIEWTWVPFDSSTDVDRALLGGDIDFSVSPVNVEGAKMLAVTSEERFEYTPDTPTLKELGYDVGDLVAWRGLLIPDDVPEETQQALREAIETVTQAPEWSEFAEELESGQSVVCGDEFADHVTTEIDDTRSYYEELGIL